MNKRVTQKFPMIFFLLLFVMSLPLYASLSLLNEGAVGIMDGRYIVLHSSVTNGGGTLDSIDDIPGYEVDGVRIYVGYAVGEYDSAYSISDISSLNNEEDLYVRLDSADADVPDDTAVTIYVAADSNVAKPVKISLRFDTGDGWILQGQRNDYSFPIIAESQTVDGIKYPEDSNVIASACAEYITLEARSGYPKGEATPIIAYSVLTWPNDGIPAGNYNADVSVVIVNEG